MKTIQMTIDEPLLEKVDDAIRSLRTSRSAFIRSALELALRKYEIARLEKRHEEGYLHHPVKPGEFDEWEEIQEWGAA